MVELIFLKGHRWRVDHNYAVAMELCQRFATEGVLLIGGQFECFVVRFGACVDFLERGQFDTIVRLGSGYVSCAA